MRDAVIVSTARTPLTKAARGSFNNTTSPTLGAYSVAAAVERAVYTRSNEALGEQDVPVPVLFGTSDTFTTAPDLDALLAEAGYVPRT